MSISYSFSNNSKREKQMNCHGGKGYVIFREVFGKENFQSNIQFFHETIIPTGSEIGYHQHTGNEETYYVVEGTGCLIADNIKQKVKKGDAVITHSGSSHGLINTGKSDLKIIVFEGKY